MTATIESMAVAIAPTGKAESILAAAQRTFLAGGFGAVSMDAIAREAGARVAGLEGRPPGRHITLVANPVLFDRLHDLLVASMADGASPEG